MKKIFYIAFLLFILTLSKNCFCQPVPLGDNSWIISKNEEFTGPTVDGSYWLWRLEDNNPDWRAQLKDRYLDGICDTFELQALRSDDNLYFVSGCVRQQTIKLETPLAVFGPHSACCCQDAVHNDWCIGCTSNQNNCWYCLYQGGNNPNYKPKVYRYATSPWLLSRWAYKYGYFEARLQCTEPPIGKNHNGYGANFWLQGTIPGHPDYSEIDILEFISWDYNNNYNPVNHMYTCNSHYDWDTFPPPKRSDGTQQIGHIDFSNGQFHIFAAEWTPTFIKYYLDNTLVYVSHNNPNNMEALRLTLDVNTFTSKNTSLWPNNNTVTPYNFDIDWVRVWHLNVSNCNSNYSNCGLGSIVSSLYKSIKIGGQGCNGPTLQINERRFLRAIDYILLDSGFEAPLGSELILETMPSHVQDSILVVSQSQW